MEFDREKRIDTELNDVDRVQDDQVEALLEQHKRRPGKQTRLDQLLERITTLPLAKRDASSGPGRHTLVEELYRAPDFDEMRALGLRDVLRSLGGVRNGRKLQDATLASADPAIVRSAGKPTPSGQAMWRVAERRAATLYRNAVDSGEITPDDPTVEAAVARCGSGQPLPTSVRKRMEAELDVSLDRVRVHTDAVANQAARAVRAKAFTVGEDIFFAASEFAPDTRAGQKLLAHELAHVVQAWQGRTDQSGRVSDPSDSLEREADAVADRFERAPTRTKPAGQGARTAAPARRVQPRAVSTRGPTQRLLRKAEPGDSAPRNQQAPANAPPGKVGPNGERGTVPTVRVTRDHGRELSEKATRGGRKQMEGAVTDLSQRVGAAANTSLTQMKSAVTESKGKPVGKKAKTAGKASTDKQNKAAAKATAAAKQAKVEAKAVKPTAAGKSDSGGGSKSPIQFKKISSWDKYMPEPMADQDDRERKRILKLVKKRVEGERAQSQQSLEKLRAAQMKQASAVRAMKGPLQAQISAAQNAALAQVSASERAQSAAVSSHVASQQASVTSHAGAMKSQINAAHSAAMTAINAATRTANQKLQTAKQQALTDIQTAETTQLAVVAMQFLSCRMRIIAVGSAKAGEAMGVPGTVSWSYDGEKLEAAQKAAQETAAAYAAAMPEEASKAATQIGAEQPNAERDIRKIAADQRVQINAVFDQSKQVIEQAHQQAVTAANTAKQQAIAQVDATAASTNAGLASHGQSQVAAIAQQAVAARAGITKAGSAASAGIVKAVTQAASGIEKGAKGLIAGAREVETPDVAETNRAVQEGSQQLAQGANQVVAGLKKNATQSATSLTQQATGAVQGITSTATAAKAQATQMATGAKQGMTQQAQGAVQGLQQVGEGYKKMADEVVKGGEDGFKQLVEATRSAYSTATTQLTTALNGVVTDVTTSFGEAVPTKEKADIIANGNKAADAVKPWWQKALAFVVSVIVAVVVVVVVTALIVTTGPVGAILVGAAAGALGSVAGQMASNLVLGNGVFEGITWQSVAMGAIGGGLAAGLTAGLGATASSLAAGGSRFAPAAVRLGTALNGGAGLANYGIRLGVNVGSDFVSDAGAQLIVTGKYEFSAQNLVTSIATNAVTSTRQFEAAQQNVGGRVRAAVGLPPINVTTPTVSGDGGGGGSGGSGPGPITGQPQGAAPTGGQPQGAAPTGGQPQGAAPTGGQPQGGQPQGADPAPTGAQPQGAQPTGADPQPQGAQPTGADPQPQGAQPTGGQPQPTGGQPQPQGGQPTGADPQGGQPQGAQPTGGQPQGGQPQGGQPTGADPQGGQPQGGQPTGADPQGGQPAGTQTQGGPNPTPDGTGPGPRPNDQGGPRPTDEPGGTQTTQPTTEAGGAQPRPTDQGTGPRPTTDEPGGAQTPTPEAPTGARPTDQDARPEAGQNDGRGGDGDGDAPVSAADAELNDLGYPEGTKAKADEAAGAVEAGTTPTADSVRDTQANQDGIRQLQELMNDPRLTPEQRQQAMRDLAERMRAGTEPTGNLARDVAEVRAQAEARARAEAEANATRPGTDPNATGTTPTDPNAPRPNTNEPAGPRPDPATDPNATPRTGEPQGPARPPEGLRDGPTMEGFVDSMRTVEANWAKMTPDERMAAIGNALNAQLAAAGIPPVTIVRKPLGQRGGELDFATWSVTLNESMLLNGTIDPAAMAALTNTTYHEARHGEQWFQIARHMSTSMGMDPATIAAQTYIPRHIVDAAVADTTPMTPAQRAQAETFYNSVYGTNRPHRDAVLTALEATPKAETAARQAEADRLAEYRAVENDPNVPYNEKLAKWQAWDTAHQQADAATTAREQAYQDYRNLPEEADAWATGDAAGDAYRNPPPAGPNVPAPVDPTNPSQTAPTTTPNPTGTGPTTTPNPTGTGPTTTPNPTGTGPTTTPNPTGTGPTTTPNPTGTGPTTTPNPTGTGPTTTPNGPTTAPNGPTTTPDGPTRPGHDPDATNTTQPEQTPDPTRPEQPLATSEETRQHIHEGGIETDVQSPYRGKWDGKGVHDWDTLQRIVARDGYRITQVSENPQTGVRRVTIERPQFKADSNGVLQPVLDANGVQRVGKIEKTIYPRDLAPGDIDAAGEAAIRAALAGDANTKVDQPDPANPKKDGTPKDGYFEATVTIGDPPRQVRIQGWWKTGANGNPEITSHAPMRPQKDAPWPTVDPSNDRPVGGSGSGGGAGS